MIVSLWWSASRDSNWKNVHSVCRWLHTAYMPFEWSDLVNSTEFLTAKFPTCSILNPEQLPIAEQSSLHRALIILGKMITQRQPDCLWRILAGILASRQWELERLASKLRLYRRFGIQTAILRGDKKRRETSVSPTNKKIQASEIAPGVLIHEYWDTGGIGGRLTVKREWENVESKKQN